MAKTREDYFSMGRECLQKEDGPDGFGAPYPREGKSWQAQAFWEGYEAEKHRLSAKTQPDAIRMEHMPGNTRGWPPAAAEHARLLAARINQGGADRARLYRALHRLQERWGVGSKRTVNN